MRSSAMSNGVSVRWAEARAMMMKPVQMVTVTTAASRPMVREKNASRDYRRPPHAVLARGLVRVRGR